MGPKRQLPGDKVILRRMKSYFSEWRTSAARDKPASARTCQCNCVVVFNSYIANSFDRDFDLLWLDEGRGFIFSPPLECGKAKALLKSGRQATFVYF